MCNARFIVECGLNQVCNARFIVECGLNRCVMPGSLLNVD